MSTITNKSPAKTKSTAKKNKAVEQINAALAIATRKTATLGQLVLTDLNVRKKKSTPESIRELASTIKAVGLLQNLIVFNVEDGQLGVAAGERRTLALRHLQSLKIAADKTTPNGMVDDNYPVDVLVVSKDIARLISYTENGQHEKMHPADLLGAFRDMTAEGRSPEQIAALLGLSTLFVKKRLKLTTMAPALLDLLAQDTINLDQLAALSATDDHARQIAVWEQAQYGYSRTTPKALRESVLNNEVSAQDNPLAEFVGIEAYEAAGGETRQDLLAEAVIITDPMKLEQVAISKLNDAAAALAQLEGWAWSLGRIQAVRGWGEDEKAFRIQMAPKPALTEDELMQVAELEARIEEQQQRYDEGDGDDEELQATARTLRLQIEQIEETAAARGWAEETRSQCGVVAYLDDGVMAFQRGIMRADHIKEAEKAPRELNPDENTPEEKGLSAVLVTSLSAERTLAVSAALAQNPLVALALHTFTLARKRFGEGWHQHALHSNVDSQRYFCLKHAEAANAENSPANFKIQELHDNWLSRLPTDWEQEFSWLLSWPQQDVVALLAYCVSSGIDGVTSQLVNHRVASQLEPVEAALDFDIHAWWQPTTANYFSRINKTQIIDALDDAGLPDKAREAEKMKRKDAATFAESLLKDSGWVPTCMANSETKSIDAETSDIGAFNPFDNNAA